jgi:alkanesulfonate monooxygenase SsuD/methylene tetrahydromethanopterin reductase-like flavin-dependent oxidoreductase (luciferase family)
MGNNSERRIRFGLWYDFRNPPGSKMSYKKLYEDILSQIEWIEELGYEYVWLTEHHFTEDGYSPSILPIAAAIASRTKKIRIATGIALLPLHDPIRLAEDGATVDIISGGRFELGGAVGYKVDEFKGFNIPRKERGDRADEVLEIVTRLWRGEKLNFKGKYYIVSNVKISPEPVQKPNPPIWVGGFVNASAKRAVKYADGFMGGGGPIKPIYEQYVEELQKQGKPTDNLRIANGIHWLYVSEDPEKTWNEAADGVIYQTNKYAEWFRQANMDIVYERVRDKEHLRKMGRLNIVDVDTCISMIKEHISDVPISHFLNFAIPPGLPPRWAEPHLELFAKKVIPAFRP